MTAIRIIDNHTELTSIGTNTHDEIDTYIELYGGVCDNIGIAGTLGFGVGVCKPENLPSGMTGLSGYTQIGHENYGNYQFSDGSIMCYVPAYWAKEGTGTNGLAINVTDIKNYTYFDDEATANAAGYALPDAFMDGGSIQPGVFVDKYRISKNALGTGFVGSSIKNGLPISVNAAHNPIADLTACSSNYNYQVINAAHARDGVGGAVNPNSNFFAITRQILAMLARLSKAHGQASVNTTNCAWYDATNNFPKGCNDDALGDTNDGTILYETDGYSNCGKTGSGTPFAKTTHNGQECGIADLNGLMWLVTLGMTCISSSAAIEAITSAATPVFTWTSHGLSVGDYVMTSDITQSDWSNLNNKMWKVATIPTNDTYTLETTPDTSGYAAYDAVADGGTMTKGTFYKKKDSVSMKNFTDGNSSATDHWGATGVAAMMDEFDMVVEAVYPNNGFSQRMGSGANQVLSPTTSGNAAILTSLGIPEDADGIDTTGTNLFGKDNYYQFIRNELCMLSVRYWNSASSAGVWGADFSDYRLNSRNSTGSMCACYPV